jgi:hypothetical protein
VSSVEEALIEMYLAGVWVRGVEDIIKAVKHAGIAVDGVGAQQEDLCDDRGFGATADREYPYVHIATQRSTRHRSTSKLILERTCAATFETAGSRNSSK